MAYNVIPAGFLGQTQPEEQKNGFGGLLSGMSSLGSNISDGMSNLGSNVNDRMNNMSPAQMAMLVGGLQMVGSNKRAGPAMAQALPGAMAAYQMGDKLMNDKEEKEKKRRLNQSMSALITSPQFMSQLNLPAETVPLFTELAQEDGMTAYRLASEFKKGGQGRFLDESELPSSLRGKGRAYFLGPDGAMKELGKDGSLVTIGMGDGSKGWSKSVMEAYNATQDAGGSAGSLISSVGQVRDLLDSGVKTGANEPWKLEVKKRLGIDIGQVAGQEALTALSTQMILPQVKQLGVNPTDKDLAFVVTASPGLEKTDAGNRLMLDALELKGKRQQVISQEAAKYIKEARAAGIDGIDAQLGLDDHIREVTRTNPLWTEAPRQLQTRMRGVISGGKGDSEMEDPIFKKYQVQ